MNNQASQEVAPNAQSVLLRLIALSKMVLVIAALRAAQPPTIERPTGIVAFASLAARGWDIYDTDLETNETTRLSDHAALDYNASYSPDGQNIAFVSERDGNMELYVVSSDGSGLQRRTNEFALDDHPTWSPDGKRIAFVSTRQPRARSGQAWNAIYAMDADGSDAQRLSPVEATDYSPAWSPQSDLIAFATGSGQSGKSDVYTMKPDGRERQLVVENGGWPTFSPDGAALFFHSRRGGRWGIWRIGVNGSGLKRVTPEEVTAYTPSASSDGKTLAMAVQRGKHRQIERFDLATGTFFPVTNEAIDHWNPSLSPDGKRVVYHKSEPDFQIPNVELWAAPPESDLRLFRLDGTFPAFSPDGERIALTSHGFGGLDVMNLDGSNRQTIYHGKSRAVFGTTWAREGNRIAFSIGPTFRGPGAAVNVAAIRPDGSEFKQITDLQSNNGFPAYSPDGEQVVIRSGREGDKNLYILHADGFVADRLTEGNWTDTMSNWSRDGEWITFASNRDGEFDIWLVKPNGTGLRKLIGGGGRNNHPHFSPNGKWIVFTSQRAGYSAEEISLPRQPQPYGDLFAIRIDSTGLIRLTHNGFEEGTPAWGWATRVTPANEDSTTSED